VAMVPARIVIGEACVLSTTRHPRCAASRTPST
jgi:hypothetical protein